MEERLTWQENFQRLSLNSAPIEISQESSQHDLDFQHKLDHQNERENVYPNFNSPVTLRYRDSVSSSASSTLSRNSTLSSGETRYFSSLGSPESPSSPTPLWNANQPAPLYIPSNRLERPSSLSPIRQNYQHQPFEQIIEPTGCFIPIKPLPYIQRTEITRHHYVVPTFAMAGQTQAEVMKLIFNQSDNKPFEAKEEYERTIPWHIDSNSSLVTLSQYTSLGKENPISRNYLLGLGQRLGITTILVIVSIESIGTVYPLLDSLIKSMELDTNENNLIQKDQYTWWSRVVIIVNQQHGVSDQVAFNQRKDVLSTEMPRIQERYRLSQPISVLFLSTVVYDQIRNTPQGTHYQLCCQRILWQMMENHTLGGRWCSEIISLQNRNNDGSSLLNVLNEDDETTSSEDEAHVMVIEYENGKKKKPVKMKKKAVSSTPTDVLRLSPFNNSNSQIQRRATRRQIQKLHCHDGDDGSELPVSIRRV